MKVIDQLRTLKTGYQWAEHKPTKYFSLDYAPLPDEMVPYPNKWPIYETTAILKMRQMGNGVRPDSIESKLIQEKAAIAMARELYGDVLERLYSIRETLYEEGPRYNDQVLREINNLIDDLNLKDRFE